MIEWRILASLTPSQRDEIVARAQPRAYEPGAILFHEGEVARSLHLIASGRVAARLMTASGDTVTVQILVPGDVVGEMALLVGDSRRSATGVALEPVETLVLDVDDLNEARGRYPGINDALLASLASTVRRLDAQLVEALYLPAEVRLARRLVGLVAEYGRVIPLRQEDLAGLTGTTRATVNRALRRAERSGYVRLMRGRVHVLDVEAIEGLANP